MIYYRGYGICIMHLRIAIVLMLMFLRDDRRADSHLPSYHLDILQMCFPYHTLHLLYRQHAATLSQAVKPPESLLLALHNPAYPRGLVGSVGLLADSETNAQRPVLHNHPLQVGIMGYVRLQGYDRLLIN